MEKMAVQEIHKADFDTKREIFWCSSQMLLKVSTSSRKVDLKLVKNLHISVKMYFNQKQTICPENFSSLFVVFWPHYF